MPSKEQLTDKIALVTGGGTGIGRGIAEALANEGAKVVVVGRRPEPLQETVTLIEAEGQTATAIAADLTDETEVTKVITRIEDMWGSVDILVNNAGMHGRPVPLHEHKTSTWDKTLDLNLRTPFLLTRAVLPAMRAQAYGHIVNISSEAGLIVYEGSGVYTISKHALNALTELTQVENQDYNIHAHAVCPGMVDTPMVESLATADNNMLSPADIGELVRWLVTRRDNIKIGRPVLIQTMKNPWQTPEE